MMALFKKKAQDPGQATIEMEELETRVNFLSEINKTINMKENRVDVISQKKTSEGWEIRAEINLDPFSFITTSDGHIVKFEEVVPAEPKKRGLFSRSKPKEDKSKGSKSTEGKTNKSTSKKKSLFSRFKPSTKKKETKGDAKTAP